MAKSPFLVFFGDEDFSLDQEIASARNRKDRVPVLLNGHKLADSDLVRTCEEIRFDDAKRVVIVDDAQKVKGDSYLKEYLSNQDPSDKSTILMAVVRGPKLPAIWKRAAELGVSKEHKKLAPWQTGKAISRISAEAKTLGVRLEEGVPELIVRFTGMDLARHVGELKKLALVASGGVITKGDVRRIIQPAVPADPYLVAEAALLKDSRRALSLLSLVCLYLGDGAYVPVSSALIKQVEKLTTVRYLLDRGDTPEDIAGYLEMHPFRFQQTLLPQAKKHTLSSLLGQMEILCKLDSTVKGAARSKRTHIELALLSVST